MLVEAARDARHGSVAECSARVSKSFKTAVGRLKDARDELITEASGMAIDDHIGPVLTPEAILIMLMERLVCGVYGNGNVDVINIFEESLEHLVRAVVCDCGTLRD